MISNRPRTLHSSNFDMYSHDYSLNCTPPGPIEPASRFKNAINVQKMSKKCSKCLPYLQNNFGKSSEIFGMWSEIFRKSSKRSSLVCLCNKQNITCLLVDMNFIFSCSTRHITRLLRSLVRYRVEHSKIKFISTRGHHV